MDCDAGRSRGLTRQSTCVTTTSRTIHSRAKSVATPTRRRRSPIIIRKSSPRSNGRLKTRADGKDRDQRAEVPPSLFSFALLRRGRRLIRGVSRSWRRTGENREQWSEVTASFQVAHHLSPGALAVWLVGNPQPNLIP